MIEKNDIQYLPKQESIKVNAIKYPAKKRMIQEILESVTTTKNKEKIIWQVCLLRVEIKDPLSLVQV